MIQWMGKAYFIGQMVRDGKVYDAMEKVLMMGNILKWMEKAIEEN